MRAMLLTQPGRALSLTEVPKPRPGPRDLLLKISACALCRTDLHIYDGELPNPKLPLIMGHQIVGRIENLGKDVTGLKVGDRVGVPWLGSACGSCLYCRLDQENLCDKALYTGYQIDGGFAEYCVADSRFVFPLPENYTDTEVSPLLCAGLIGFRCLRKAENAEKTRCINIGFYGFGASAHILIQIVNKRGGKVYAFTKKGDREKQDFAKALGAFWVGDSETLPETKLDAAIIFASVGSLIPQALKALRKGGRVVCAGIHMSDIPSFPYSLLWEERSIISVANLTRQDGKDFLALAPKIPVKTEVHTYSLERVNEAIEDFRHGRISGSAVITVENSEESNRIR